MTRRKLKTLGSDTRRRFRAKFVKLADEPGYRGLAVAIIFKNVKLWPDGDRVAGRVSFTWATRFQRLGKLQPGQWIEFEARVAKVETGYDGPDYLRRIECPIKIEWKLRHPSKVRKVSQEEMARWVLRGESEIIGT
jgi:hypothetical protein